MGDTERRILSKVKWGNSFKNYEEVQRAFDDPDDAFGFRHYDKSSNVHKYPAPRTMFDLLIQIIHSVSGSNIIDFACGTGLSGFQFVDLGFTVDGIDLSEEMLKVARARGYRYTWQKNLVTDDVNGVKGYDLAICIGALGEYIPPEIVIPKMVATLEQTALLCFTSEEEHTDIRAVEQQLRGFGFLVAHKSVKPGYIDEELGEDHYYVIATRSRSFEN
ncbi:methyltransferase domain-containing protein [Candidatus Woesearchaeota archaeon]|nr:methyltransferase domain-containing protein [Candidatus Woesearchaeota archaeon]MBW3014298.1 methyltransferase domain-containing protein [Candidatus Woesearchaeota archaeon]